MKKNVLPEVKSTSDLSIFGKVLGNRPRNEAHVLRLMKSFQEEYIPVPILVNSKMEIIDGQHRVEAATRLGLPITYICLNGYGLSQVQRLNGTNRTWIKNDFLDSYCDLKLKPYQQLKEFLKNYPDFSVGTAETIMKNAHYEQVWVIDDNGNKIGRKHSFKDGSFEVPDLGLAYENAGKIMEYKPYFSEYYQSSFVRAMIALFKNPKYNHDIMLTKLRQQPTAMKVCTSIKNYIALIEDIYNFRNRDKVNLRLTTR